MTNLSDEESPILMTLVLIFLLKWSIKIPLINYSISGFLDGLKKSQNTKMKINLIDK